MGKRFLESQGTIWGDPPSPKVTRIPTFSRSCLVRFPFWGGHNFCWGFHWGLDVFFSLLEHPLNKFVSLNVKGCVILFFVFKMSPGKKTQKTRELFTCTDPPQRCPKDRPDFWGPLKPSNFLDQLPQPSWRIIPSGSFAHGDRFPRPVRVGLFGCFLTSKWLNFMVSKWGIPTTYWDLG